MDYVETVMWFFALYHGHLRYTSHPALLITLPIVEEFPVL